jgi:hypothetical protein
MSEPKKAGKEVLVLVPTTTFLALLVASLIAVVELGPPSIGVPVGASPLNTGKLGTSKLLYILKERFGDVRVVRDWLAANKSVGACGKLLIVIVSPEKPFTEKDLDSIKSLSKKCSTTLLFIADETGHSNTVLESLGFGARVDGRLLLELSQAQAPGNASFFLKAFFNYPGGYSDELYLDKASFIELTDESSKNLLILGVTSSREVAVVSNGTVKTVGGGSAEIPVAVLEIEERRKALVISDGSILTNQVLEDETWGRRYERLLKESIDLLANESGSVLVLVDSTKYEYVDPARLLNSNPQLYADPLTLASYMVVRLIHPSTWFPSVIDLVNNLSSKLFSVGTLISIAAAAFSGIFITMLILSRTPERVEDRAMEKIISKDYFTLADLREKILAERVSLGKEDFITLYEIVNEVFKDVVGVPLSDERLINVLTSRGLDPVKARKFWKGMNGTYSKARKRFGFPPIIMWGRLVKKRIAECEEVLNSVGTSLLKDLGFEYVLMR